MTFDRARRRRHAIATGIAAAAIVAMAATIAAQRGGGPPAPVRDNGVRPIVTGDAFIGGVVVTDESTPRPLRLASVTLRDLDRGLQRLSVTDERGTFGFSRLPAGHYLISVDRPPYVPVTYGARTARGQGLTIALEDGQRLDAIRVAMPRGAAITGRIVDERGAAVSSPRVNLAVVEAIVIGSTSSYRRVYGQTIEPDDRGIYRIYGLPAGTYFIGATPGLFLLTRGASPRVPTDDEIRWATRTATTGPGVATGPPPAAPATALAEIFYPGVTDIASATPVTLAAGEERAGVDIVIRAVPVATIRGVVRTDDGAPARSAQVLAASSTDRALADVLPALPSLGMSAADGSFVIGNLAPGHYRLMSRASSAAGGAPAPARGSPPPGSDLWALADVDVAGADIDDVTLTLAPGMTVSGRVVFDATSLPPPDPATVRFTLTPPPTGGPVLGAPSTQAEADGTFAFKGIAPGSYVLYGNAGTTATVQPLWMVKTAMLNGRDVLDTPFDVTPNLDVSDLVVTFTDRVTKLTGLVSDQAGHPVPAYSVIAFSTDPTWWRAQSRRVRMPVRPASDGRFTISGLPPGEYYLAVLPDFPPNEWSTPAFLQAVVPGAIRVTIRDGETTTQDVRLAG
jgi:hypothetical protein